ncbi:ABC transporter ATP-binding protein [Vulgatibacter incomptus]|uniref:YbbL ABC transporter ATP-binding protein n=1 Tax=Vulgatibacter incomptus TaxID=1391653 RepID=A0A0K1P8A1_9BACT|nr:ATP-binding cassette domain-containing protein [Vulgatibacter incomptus]AKU89740.1 YbbL ABC transporter ATP-binding protein [Vulgatibacter incomptus]
MEHGEPLLVMEGLGRRLEGSWIFRGLSFEVRAGEKLALAGPSGAGKTLLLRTLAGLDRMDEGELELEGVPFRQWSAPAWRSRICYLHQRPALLPGTVEENLRRPFLLEVHRGREFDRELAEELLGRLGRDPALLTQRASTLSGGEAQIVALVRALLLAPRVLLLDEPTASLDRETAGRAETVIDGWISEAEGRALVWTSHEPAQLERIASRRIELPRSRSEVP